MSTQTVVYLTTEPIACEDCLPSDVVLCVPNVLTANGFGFLDAEVISYLKSTTCGSAKRSYTLEYDDAQLADPNTPLLPCEISGIFCKDCEFRYAEYLSSVLINGWETDLSGNLIQKLSYTGDLLYNNGFNVLANGFDNGQLGLGGGQTFSYLSGAILALRGKGNIGSAVLKGADVATGHVTLEQGHASSKILITNVAGAELWNYDSSGNLNGDGTLGGNINLNHVGKTLNIKAGANGAAGTFTANGTSAVVVPNTFASISMVVVPSLQTLGGTPAGHPYVSAISPGVSFTMKAAAGDTSVYNYIILGTT